MPSDPLSRVRPYDLGTFAWFALEDLVFPALDRDPRLSAQERDELRDFDREPRVQIVHDAGLIADRQSQQPLVR